MIDDSLTIHTRRRSPTFNSSYNPDFFGSLFIFSDDVKEELSSKMQNSHLASFDDNDAGFGIGGGRVEGHRRVPTAPNFSFLSNQSTNIPIIRRPIKPLSPDIYKQPPMQTNEFTVQPKPSDYRIDAPQEFDVFYELVNDLDISINPKNLGFIPNRFWPEGDFLIRDLVSDYFQQPCGSYSRFSHKLFNALQKVNVDPFYATFFGVEWLNETALSVNGPLFGFILGYDNYETELFGQGGQLDIHGFVEMNQEQALSCVDASQLENIDFITTRVFIHNTALFTRSSSPDDIVNARWSRKKRYRSSSLQLLQSPI